MIAVDTNVLLRYLLQDDLKQSKKATQLILGSEKILVLDIVLVETAWTLTGKKYSLSRDDLVKVINVLFEESNIVLESAQVVWRALSDYRNAKPIKAGGRNKVADFADALIVNKAHQYTKSLGLKLAGVATFDKAAQTLEGTIQP